MTDQTILNRHIFLSELDKDGLKALRLTRARLWLICELLTTLDDDNLAPPAFQKQGSLFDRDWKRAWLGEVQGFLNAGITHMDKAANARLTQIYGTVPQEFLIVRNYDQERLTQGICKLLSKKVDTIPAGPDQDKLKALRLARSLLAVVGELCGDLGSDYEIPKDFTGDESLLNHKAEITRSNRSKNLELTQDFKDNLVKMQESMIDAVQTLSDDHHPLYDQEIEGKSLAALCGEDAEEVEERFLIPFAAICEMWDFSKVNSGSW